MRYVSSAVNLGMGILLFIILRIKIKELALKTNRLVLNTLAITFAFDLSPHLVSGIFYAIQNVNITTFIGPFSSVFMAIETTCCALIYLKAFKIRFPWQKKGIMIHSTVSNSHKTSRMTDIK
uniref:Uncharacterized protein n=1 Tax=Panagrolaimus sp. JU765 TaxID=591449 RepID=A0AC34PYU2_9BILA